MHIQILVLFCCLLIFLSAREEKWGIEITKLCAFLFPPPQINFSNYLGHYDIRGYPIS